MSDTNYNIESNNKSNLVWDKLSNNAINKMYGDYNIVDNFLKTNDVKDTLNEFESNKTFKDFIVNNFLNKKEYILEQTKLHLLNKLTSRFYNPLGIYLSLKVEDVGAGALGQLVTQTASTILGSGIALTSDGVTFANVADVDSDKLFFHNVDEFKGEYNNDAINTIGQKLVNIATSATIGEIAPTRSIIAQALAFTMRDADASLHLADGGGMYNIRPNGSTAIKYIYGVDFLLEHPIIANRMRQEMDKLMIAQNYRIPMSQEFINLKKNKSEYKGDYGIWSKFKKKLVNNLGIVGKDGDSDNHFKNWSEKDFWNSVFVYSYSNHQPSTKIKDYLSSHRDKKDKNPSEFPNVVGLVYGDKFVNPSVDSFPTFITSSNSTYTTTNISAIYKFTKNTEQLFQNILEFEGKVTHGKNKISSHDIDKDTNNRNFGGLFPIIIHDMKTDYVAHFNPAVTSISEDIQSPPEPQDYIGRTETIPIYSKTTRNITIAFTIYSTTPTEYLLNKKKLDFLRSLAYPKTASKTNFSRIKSPLIRFSFGDDYQSVGAYVNNVSITPNLESLWETRLNVQGAKIYDISIALTVIHDEMPMIYDNEKFDGHGYHTNEIYKQLTTTRTQIKTYDTIDTSNPVITFQPPQSSSHSYNNVDVENGAFNNTKGG